MYFCFVFRSLVQKTDNKLDNSENWITRLVTQKSRRTCKYQQQKAIANKWLLREPPSIGGGV